MGKRFIFGLSRPVICAAILLGISSISGCACVVVQDARVILEVEYGD